LWLHASSITGRGGVSPKPKVFLKKIKFYS